MVQQNFRTPYSTLLLQLNNIKVTDSNSSPNIYVISNFTLIQHQINSNLTLLNLYAMNTHLQDILQAKKASFGGVLV